MKILSALAAFMRSKPSVPQALPVAPTFAPRTVIAHADDSSTHRAHTGLATSTLLEIDYRDAKGNITRRKIYLKRVTSSAGGDLLLASFCYKRKAVRLFRASRILDCIDCETGEVFPDVQGFLRNHVLYDASVGPVLTQATSNARWHGVSACAT
jgi:hypothetical protein